MKLGRNILSIACWLLICLFCIPLLITVVLSFSPDSFLTFPTDRWSLQWYGKLFQDPRWWDAIQRSFIVGIATAFFSVVLATPLAIAVSKQRNRLFQSIPLLIFLTNCIPAVVLGLGLLMLIYRIELWGTYWGIIIAHTLVALPVVYLLIQTHMKTRLVELELAARGLGASTWQVWWRITFPNLRPTLLVAGIAAGTISWNESILTLFIATPSTETLPAVVWPQLRFSPTPLVAVASTISILLAILFVGGSLRWISRMLAIHQNVNG
ncbi:MAG: ABC transporter permease [Zavarzinella sp.]